MQGKSQRASQFCAACRHNRMIPDLMQPQNVIHWRMVEGAKHRLFYTLLKLRLPLITKTEDPDGLAFDFIAYGHASDRVDYIGVEQGLSGRCGRDGVDGDVMP